MKIIKRKIALANILLTIFNIILIASFARPIALLFGLSLIIALLIVYWFKR